MARHLRLLSAMSALTITFTIAGVSVAPSASAAELCGKWDTIDVQGGEYIVMNNVWGADTTQCIEVDESTGAFQVTRSDHSNPNSSVASYPTIYKGCHWGACTVNSSLPLRVDQIESARSSWSINTNNASGAWNAAYDIWYHTNSDVNRAPDGAEVMIWLDYAGGIGPAGSQVGTVQISGSTWNVHFAAFSDWNYIAYVRAGATSSVSDLDIEAFTDDAVSRGYIQPSWYMSGVEAGFELWRQGAGLTSNSFSFEATAGDDDDDEPPGGGGDCTVQWQTDDWGSGFVAHVTVTNNGPAVSEWVATWTFGGNQTITNYWNTQMSPSGQSVTARNMSWNGSVGSGASVNFGFQASYSGSNSPPDDFTFNGALCTMT